MTDSDLLSSIDKYWEDQIVPALKTYIEIPAKSPSFDPDWKKSGHIHRALELVVKWIDDKKIPNLKKEVFISPNHSNICLIQRIPFR